MRGAELRGGKMYQYKLVRTMLATIMCLFIVLILWFFIVEYDYPDYTKSTECYNQIAKEFCLKKWLDWGYVYDTTRFGCKNPRENKVSIFYFLDTEKDRCNKLIIDNKRGVW